MIIIPIKLLLNWEYTLFSDKPMWFFFEMAVNQGKMATPSGKMATYPVFQPQKITSFYIFHVES